MAEDRNAGIKFHKRGKSNVKVTKQLYINRSTVWKVMKKFQETGNTLDRPRRKKPRLLSAPQKHEGKAAMKFTPKQRNLSFRSRCEQTPHVPGVVGRSGGEALQDAASPGAYGQSCSHGDPKMLRNLPGDGRRHAAELRVHGQEEIQHPAGGKPVT